MVRAQYHFRESDDGLLAWDVRRLIELSGDFPVRAVEISDIAELDENHWYSHAVPTCRSIIEHCELIQNADLQYPVILDQNGGVMDGMHRICHAAMNGLKQVRAVQFEVNPEPDYVGRHPDTLPYED